MSFLEGLIQQKMRLIIIFKNFPEDELVFLFLGVLKALVCLGSAFPLKSYCSNSL